MHHAQRTDRILLVDDEPQVLMALGDVLGGEFDVLTTNSPDRALEVVQHDEEIAVVVSDERMPGMPGAELFTRIRDKSRARHVLVTGFADLSAVIRAVNEGRLFAYVTKPWDDDDLKQKVRMAADQFRLARTLTSEHQLLHDLMDNTPDGIYFKDRKLCIRGANEAFAKLIGAQSVANLVGRTLQEIDASLRHLDEIHAEESEILRTGKLCLDVVRDYSTASVLLWISETKAAIRGPEGEIVGVVGIARDVTERVRLGELAREGEARLRQQRNLLDTVLNSMREAVIACDRDGSIVLSNRRAQRMFGAMPTNQSALHWAQSRKLKRADHDVLLTGSNNPLAQAVCGVVIDEVEVEIAQTEPEGAVWAVTGTPLRNEDGSIVGGLALLKDVTDRRMLARQLGQAQKMEAVGLLAGGVAHDFNNLLSVITGFGELIQTRLAEDDPNHADLAEILGAAERAARLTHQLLSVSRRETAQPRLLQLNDIVLNLERMFERIIGDHIEIHTVLDPDLNPIWADVGQLEQVLLNLTVNARDAMPRGGKLTFRTANTKLTEARISPFTNVPRGTYVVFTVSDTGVGMSPETLKRVFEPFFTTKAAGEGTGLGLAMVYGIVQQSSGYIDIRSTPAKGTTFEIFLPCATYDAPPTRTVRIGAGSAKPNAAILLVEDNEAVRDIASRILKAHGHLVVECGSPSEALTAANARTSRFDVFLLDIMLPEMSGISLARQLLGDSPGTALLFMSGYPGQSVIDESVFGSRVGFVEKPFTSQSLTDAVQALTSMKRSSAG